MFRKLGFFALLLIVGRTVAQICIPNPVEVVNLSQDGILSWDSSDNCAATTYQIVIKTGGVIEYQYTVDTVSLDVSFLTLCRVYTFGVTPIADHVLGLETSYNSSLLLDTSTDIAIQNFTGNQIADDILIQWLVNPNYTYCISYYNLRIWDEDTATPTSVYIGQAGYLIEHVAQCMNYYFEITAYYSGANGSTGEFNYTVPAKTNFPSLVELRQDATTINTTWSLEPYYLNRCNITNFFVNGTHFNVTLEVEDTPQRPDIQVSVTDLRADTLYYFNVSTNNVAGVSKGYQLAVQTLSLQPNLA